MFSGVQDAISKERQTWKAYKEKKTPRSIDHPLVRINEGQQRTFTTLSESELSDDAMKSTRKS